MDLFERYDMVGGEVHYGRVQPRYWGAILDAVKSLGARVLACYVMWDYHELREGQYDFSQLHAFLKEVAARGLKVLARPGPFCYAEWRNLGIPDHAVPYHKYHSEFRRKAVQWIAAVLAELRPYFGRLIIAVQADNEIDAMPHFYGEDQGFAEWLKQRYGSIDRLNAAWAAKYADFSEPIPTLTPFVEDQRLRDGCQYRYDLATRYARWVIAEYRRNGCDLPILLNTWPGVDAQHWHDLADLADFYGIDPYPTNECRSDFRYFRERLRLLRAVTPNLYLAEFGSGIWHGMPDRQYTPDHYRLTALTALASGVKGWNWYMLADRDNWHGAPINERGVVRPELGDAFRDAVGWFEQLRHAPPPEVSCTLTWSWHYHQVAQIRKRDADEPLLPVLHEMGLAQVTRFR
jgi:beta-galactosidase